jgi:AmiR/NasT family two-component response regulator
VRTEAPIDAEYIAELISVNGGGRVGSAAAQLTVPEMCEDMPVDHYMLLLLSYIEMKLTWPRDSLWD